MVNEILKPNSSLIAMTVTTATA